MAVRDGEPYLRYAIESVLAQSITEFEFLIVDDASCDVTPEILSEYQRRDARISILRNETTLGPYGSANRGMALARGKFITRHDADDVSPPDRFAIQLEPLERDPGVCLVLGAVEVFGSNQNDTWIARPPAWQPRLEWELLFRNAAMAGAHPVFPRVIGGAPVLFPAVRPYSEDYGLWCRLSRLGRVVSPEQVVYRYRRHEQSITSRKRVEQFECMAQIRRDYQAPYLRPDVSISDLSTFWVTNGRRPLASVNTIYGIHRELLPNFLAYVERRYGPADRARLAAELDDALSDRLGYWLYRSVRFFDGRACRDVLSIARARHEAMTVSSRALGQVTAAVLGRLSSVAHDVKERGTQPPRHHPTPPPQPAPRVFPLSKPR
jgi:glycosyltransferase involved in cell wall biosynthesis